ncbi:hypothetical protein GJ496_006834 [Pomphorhynchus laevis]|nr:hypothetical protein GJ496_006834 [Pomphorhynchus laevis]
MVKCDDKILSDFQVQANSSVVLPCNVSLLSFEIIHFEPFSLLNISGNSKHIEFHNTTVMSLPLLDINNKSHTLEMHNNVNKTNSSLVFFGNFTGITFFDTKCDINSSMVISGNSHSITFFDTKCDINSSMVISGNSHSICKGRLARSVFIELCGIVNLATFSASPCELCPKAFNNKRQALAFLPDRPPLTYVHLDAILISTVDYEEFDPLKFTKREGEATQVFQISLCRHSSVVSKTGCSMSRARTVLIAADTLHLTFFDTKCDINSSMVISGNSHSIDFYHASFKSSSSLNVTAINNIMFKKTFFESNSMLVFSGDVKKIMFKKTIFESNSLLVTFSNIHEIEFRNSTIKSNFLLNKVRNVSML